jgi:hypothetical protein
MTIVESALVLSVFALLMFGIFEYGRFLMILHITNNAARDGARYAAVNLDKPTNFDTVDYTDGSGVVHPSIIKYTRQRMGSLDKHLQDCLIAAYPVDDVGLNLTPPVIRPKTTDITGTITYPDPFNQSDPNKTAWNTAAFTQRVAVTIKGRYYTALPNFLWMPNHIDLYLTALAASEGG